MFSLESARRSDPERQWATHEQPPPEITKHHYLIKSDDNHYNKQNIQHSPTVSMVVHSRRYTSHLGPRHRLREHLLFLLLTQGVLHSGAVSLICFGRWGPRSWRGGIPASRSISSHRQWGRWIYPTYSTRRRSEDAGSRTRGMADRGRRRWLSHAVRILPGVRRMIHYIPHGRYAVTTSGAKTYSMYRFI